mgnify:CR=1 FL=1|tara:strand:+ start:2957 stop:3082 length:126 start_codon:yes stop_codon:yes gene_type:complete
MSGKGDRRRPEDVDKFRKNYDLIFEKQEEKEEKEVQNEDRQ